MKRTSQYVYEEHPAKKYKPALIVIDDSSDEGEKDPPQKPVAAEQDLKYERLQNNDKKGLQAFDKELPFHVNHIDGKVIIIEEEDLAGKDDDEAPIDHMSHFNKEEYEEVGNPTDDTVPDIEADEEGPQPNNSPIIETEERTSSCVADPAIPDIIVNTDDSPILAPENSLSSTSSEGSHSPDTTSLADEVQNEFEDVPALAEDTGPLYRFDLTYAKEEDVNSGGVEHSMYAQMQVADLQLKLCNSGSVEYLSSEIQSHFYNNRQDHETLLKKDQLSKRIEMLLKRIYPRSKLFMTGSSVTKLGSYNCDIDMCWYVASLRETSPYHCPTKQVIQQCLEKAKKALRHNFGPAMKDAIVIRACVPILKFKMAFEGNDFEIDININNTPGILNSKLLHYYSLYDLRFQQLVLVLKHWAILNKIKDAQYGFFNSYSIALLVLHYLQSGVHPYILPNFHKLYPQIFADQTLLMCLEYDKRFEPPRTSNHTEVNRQPVGELLIGFFHYYNTFDFNTLAISIRNGGTVQRYGCIHDDPMQYRLFIEEPFDHKNTARCITEKDNWQHIKRLFKEAFVKLLASRSDKHGLASIGIYL
uniref:PAP-associated domain-containing protein n=1 Tax=Rhabditophanes sp. KR3021 TaxID=114890 RepID=A0AC35U9T9_9BILA